MPEMHNHIFFKVIMITIMITLNFKIMIMIMTREDADDPSAKKIASNERRSLNSCYLGTYLSFIFT